MLNNDGAAEAHSPTTPSHRLGAINVPLNTRYVARELAYVLEFVSPPPSCSRAGFAPAARRRCSAVLGRRRAARGLAAAPGLGASYAEALSPTRLGAGRRCRSRPPLDEDDDADWIFTSGTTGNPKAVALTHAGSVACGYQAVALWGLTPTASTSRSPRSSPAPAATPTCSACLAAGCTYVVEPEFDVAGTLERMRRHGTTSTFLINSVLALHPRAAAARRHWPTATFPRAAPHLLRRPADQPGVLPAHPGRDRQRLGGRAGQHLRAHRGRQRRDHAQRPTTTPRR